MNVRHAGAYVGVARREALPEDRRERRRTHRVASFRHPGGNLTGFSMFEFSLGGKWVDLLKNVVPGLERVAAMFNPETSPQTKFFMPVIEAAAASLGVQVISMPVRAIADFEPALVSFANQSNSGLILPADVFLNLHESLIGRPGEPLSPTGDRLQS